jgi:hypothetical protein
LKILIDEPKAVHTAAEPQTMVNAAKSGMFSHAKASFQILRLVINANPPLGIASLGFGFRLLADG